MLAPRLASGLQRFAKPWWRRRALRIFRDESSLTASPHLWDSIARALDSSGWFILLLSPEAAASPWVNREIDYWAERYSVDRILPVLTDGELTWNGNALIGSAIPPSLAKIMTAEPRWVDLRFAAAEEQLDLKNPRFLSVVADIASAIRGIPKEDLESEEVRQHRRTRRTAGLAVGLIAILAIAAAVAAVLAFRSADSEAQQRLIAEANAADAQARLLAVAATRTGGDDDLAKLLGLQALETGSLGETSTFVRDRLVEALVRSPPVDTVRLAEDIRSSGPLRLSATRSVDALFAAWGGENVVFRLASDGAIVWQTRISGEVQLVSIAVELGGNLVAVGVSGVDGRVIVLDAASGRTVSEIGVPDCAIPSELAWSPSASWLAWGSGPAPCSNGEARHWVQLTDTKDWDNGPVVGVDVANPKPSFDQSDRLIVLQPFSPAAIYDPPGFIDAVALPLSGSGVAAPDASTFVMSQILPEEPSRIRVFERSGELRQHVVVPEDAVLDGSHLGGDGVLVLGMSNRDAVVVDTTTGELLVGIEVGPATSFIADLGLERLITGHRDGTVKFWDLSTILMLSDAGPSFPESEEFLDVVRQSLSRTFRPDECEFFQIDPCPTLDEVKAG